MEQDKFKKPDDAAISRMTVRSVSSLIETLKDRRAAKVKPLDEEIKYYEGLLKQKQEELDRRNNDRNHA